MSSNLSKQSNSSRNVLRSGVYYALPLLLPILALIALWTAWGRSDSIENIYMHQISNGLKVRSRILIPRFKKFLKTPKNHEELYHFSRKVAQAAEVRITLINEHGDVLCDSENEQPLPNHRDQKRQEIETAILHGFGSSIRYSSTLQERMLYAAQLFKDDHNQKLILRTALSVKSIDAVLNKSRQDIIFTGGIIFVIMICLAYIAIIYVIIPVSKIRNNAQKIANGELDIRLPVSGRGTIRELAITLNEMAEQLNGRLVAITREKNQRDAILSSMTEGVIAIDLNENITNINNAAKKIFDLPQQPATMSIAELFRDNKISPFVHQIIKTATSQKQEFIIHDIEEKYIMVRGTTILNETNDISGVLLVLSDITMIKKLENFRQDFVTDVSHEIKTPLTIIRGAVETLEDGAIETPDTAKKFMDIITRHVDRLNNLVADILSLGAIEHYQHTEHQFDQCCMADLLNSAINLCHPKADKHHIAIYNENSIAININADKNLLEQAIINLLDNAIKYSEANSKIIVKTAQNKHELAISVEDFGCGIASEHLPRLFERFYRVDKARSRKLGGTGLGLSIVKHIAQLHHGSVAVDSKPGAGSTFTIRLPLNP